MSKIVISADVHFCKRESLVEDRYSFLKNSIEWTDSIDGDYYFNLGDFFNTPNLTAEDVAVLDSIKFKKSWHFITGNHEQDGTNSLLKYFRDLHTVYERPQLKNFGKDVGWVLFIPYAKHPTPLDELLKKLPETEQVIVCSHCEFVGYFGIEEGGGYSIESIDKDKRIKMWFQGHYHKRMVLSKKVVIVGNLCGQNFTQNFDKHGVVVYDTVANTYEFLENPCALVFGKMDTSEERCVEIRKMIEADSEKRFVLAIKTDNELKQSVKEWSDKYLVASRILLSESVIGSIELVDLEKGQEELESIDHIEIFKEEVTKRFGEEIANAIC